jgi:regulator of replication initiation timing
MEEKEKQRQECNNEKARHDAFIKEQDERIHVDLVEKFKTSQSDNATLRIELHKIRSELSILKKENIKYIEKHGSLQEDLEFVISQFNDSKSELCAYKKENQFLQLQNKDHIQRLFQLANK